MTTAAPRNRTTSLAPGVCGAALVVTLLGVIATAVAAATSGPSGAYGALIGAGMVLVFFGFGALTVNSVASILPAASLLVALLTYTLQVVLLGLVFLTLTGSGATESDIDRTWLGLTAIAASLTWILMQTVGAVRARQPLYDIPLPGQSPGGEARGGDHAA